MNREVEALRKRVSRERRARKAAEALGEEKTRALHEANEALSRLNAELRETVETRTRAMERARDEALEASRAKSRFLAMISHEIRTPMNAVIGMTELVLEGELNRSQQVLLRRVLRSGEHLLALIDDLFEGARIDANGLALRPAPFDLRELVEDLCSAYAGRASEKYLRIICDLDPQLPAQSVGDAGRWRQVIGNLVSNAIKFTSVGEVAVVVDEVRSDDGRWARIAVCDTGPGIEPEDRERIFAAFERGEIEQRLKRQVRGAGLGLHITRSLTERMGGRLEVESELGEGSTFTCWLPLEHCVEADDSKSFQDVEVLAHISGKRRRRAVRRLVEGMGASFRLVSAPEVEEEQGDVLLVDADGGSRLLHQALPQIVVGHRRERLGAAAARVGGVALAEPVFRDALGLALARALGRTIPPEAPKTIPPGPRPRLLLAEDDPDNRSLLRRLLENEGYEADVVSDGRFALERLASQRYDLILTDLQMPRLDGPGLARAFRQREKERGLPRTPIVAVTAHALPSFRKECLDSGMDDFLTKPVRLEVLRQALRRWLDVRPVLLVVDDDESTRVLYEEVLGSEGRYLLTSATDTTEAFRVVEQRRVDAALVDLELGGESGLSLVRALASREPPVRALIVTGHRAKDVADRAEAAGAAGVLEKPVRPQRLREAVQALVNWTPGILVPAATELPPESSASSSSPVLEVDPDIEDLMEGFLRNRWAAVAQAGAFLAEGRLRDLQRMGHSLKGVGRSYGSATLSQLGATLEAAAERGDSEACRSVNGAIAAYLEGLRVRFPSGDEVDARDYRDGQSSC